MRKRRRKDVQQKPKQGNENVKILTTMSLLLIFLFLCSSRSYSNLMKSENMKTNQVSTTALSKTQI